MCQAPALYHHTSEIKACILHEKGTSRKESSQPKFAFLTRAYFHRIVINSSILHGEESEGISADFFASTTKLRQYCITDDSHDPYRVEFSHDRIDLTICIAEGSEYMHM